MDKQISNVVSAEKYMKDMEIILILYVQTQIIDVAMLVTIPWYCLKDFSGGYIITKDNTGE